MHPPEPQAAADMLGVGHVADLVKEARISDRNLRVYHCTEGSRDYPNSGAR